jgi:transglutaminase-like putative cysteine protease
MMRSIVSGLFLVFFSITCFAEALYPAADIPTNLRTGASAIIRDMETVVNMRASNQVVMTVKKAITVLNRNGESRAELSIYYNSNTAIKSIKGLVYDASGAQISKFSQSKFIDESAISDFSLYEDERVKHFLPSITTYPYTVVYEYEIVFKQNLIVPDWYANPYPDEAVEKSSYTFICKPEDQIRIQEKNYPGKGTTESTATSKTYHWSVTGLVAFKREPYAPQPDNYRTFIKVSPVQFTYYKSKGSYSDWKELGKWVYNDLLKSRQILSPATVAEVRDLVKTTDSDKEKARKLYSYMQDKTRYISVQVGIGGFQPMFAEDVQRLGYGDCKALVNYMQSLLNAVNIKSFYCVVNAGKYKQNMDANFASMEQGNHIILCLPMEKDTTWLECTSQVVPFGYLGDFTDDRTVLACTENGGMLLHTPNLKAEMNMTRRKADLTIDKEGNVTGKVNTVYKGAQYDTYDYVLTKPYSEQLKLLKSYYDVDNINFEGLKIKQDKGADPSTSESFDLEIPNYAPKSSSRAYVLLNAFNRQGTVAELSNRTLPLYINRGFTDEDEINYHLPDGYHSDYKPNDLELKTPYGSFSFQVIEKDHDLIYKRKFVLNAGTYPASEYAAFADFMNKVSSEDTEKVILQAN